MSDTPPIHARAHTHTHTPPRAGYTALGGTRRLDSARPRRDVRPPDRYNTSSLVWPLRSAVRPPRHPALPDAALCRGNNSAGRRGGAAAASEAVCRLRNYPRCASPRRGRLSGRVRGRSPAARGIAMRRSRRRRSMSKHAHAHASTRIAGACKRPAPASRQAPAAACTASAQCTGCADGGCHSGRRHGPCQAGERPGPVRNALRRRRAHRGWRAAV